MIYYAKEKISVWQPNLIQLDLEDELGYIYVTRNTYDQAVLIADRFNHDIDVVVAKLGGEPNQQESVDYMMAILPAPINILTPFYNLIDPTVNINVEDLKQAVGVLSYMSMSIDFNTILKVQFEVRANLTYTKSILLQYQGHFEDFNFKIIDDERHIQVSSDKYNKSRSEKDDFDLEDNKETKPFDLNSFMDDVGWDSVPTPSLLIEDVKEHVVNKNVDTQSNIIDDVSSSYSAIVNRFM